MTSLTNHQLVVLSGRTLRCFQTFFWSVALTLSLAMPDADAARTPANIARPDADKIGRARALADENKVDEAIKLMSEMIGAEKDADKSALEHMTLGLIHFRAGTADQAASDEFRKALEGGLRIPDYAHYYLGLLDKKNGRAKEARANFEKVIQAHAPKPTELDARYQLARVYLEEKQWRPAANELEILRKGLRSDERYPEILFELVRIGKQTRKPACKYARELYAKYPSYGPVSSWGPYLDKNEVDGQRLGCSADGKDLKMRIRRLWLMGDVARAEAELKLLKGETDEDGSSLTSSLYANYLIGEGRLDEALKLILKTYETDRTRPAYLMLLAKAASGAGEYQMAVSAYQRAYDMAPRGKNGATALFQAAFTSYQMQDYDGATRRFEQVVKRGGSARMARDGQWYLAWLQYLRGDYQGALDSLKSLSGASTARLGQSVKHKKRGRRRARVEAGASDSVARDRIQYWTAMSLLKLGRSGEALPILEQLVKDPSIGYYSMVAYYRLLQIPGAKLPAGVESRLGLKRADPNAAPSEEVLKAAAQEVAEQANEEMADAAATTDEPEETAEAEPTGDEEETVAASDSVAPNFKDPGLAQKFERARDLALVGLEDAARRELREIEKRARSQADRRLLMAEYTYVRNFERSSYIGETGFGSARLKTGLKGDSRVFWEYAYPRAWEPSVVQASRNTSVPEELIWGIMRAESHFRFDARSPVGALGLMQMMPFTGRKVAELMSLKSFETSSLLEPEVNIRFGSRYLQRLLEKFNSKVPLVAASYNAGPHRVSAWVRNFGSLDMDEFVEHIPYVETRNYVKRVVRNFQIYSLLYHANPKNLQWIVQPVGVQMTDAQIHKESLKETW